MAAAAKNWADLPNDPIAAAKNWTDLPKDPMTATKNWADLPKELIDLIVKRVKLIEDFIAFGVVCTSWRTSAVKANFDYLSPQLPLLMLADKGDNYREFYSLSTSKVSRPVFLPEARSRECFPMTEGWICTAEHLNGEMNLLHPLSRRIIPLPSAEALFSLVEEDYPLKERRKSYMCTKNVVLSASPSITSDYVLVVGYYANLCYAACWRPGDLNWTHIEIDQFGGVSSMIYHKGQFYCATYKGNIYVFDVPGPSIPQPIVVKTKILLHFENKVRRDPGYLVEISDALLIIFRFRSDEAKTCKFQVFEIDVNNSLLKEIKTLGKYAIFVGINGAICIDSSKFPVVKSNHIYFTDDYNVFFDCGDGGGSDMGAYNLEDGTIESFYSGVSLSHICPPTWVIPSF